MRKKIVAGNWKMNLNHQEALSLMHAVNDLNIAQDIEVLIFPSALYLSEFSQSSRISVGAQNVSAKLSGAFTGEWSASQLLSSGIKDVLIGHSERREYFNESDELLKEKVDVALSEGLRVFFCCGEPLSVRESGQHVDYVVGQLKNSLFHLSTDALTSVVVAYEPIWAIGTGVTASVEQAEEMHAALRKAFVNQYSEEVANNLSILYGGSCNPSNAKALFACPNVDGGLIGGAALKATDFSVLVAEETWTI